MRLALVSLLEGEGQRVCQVAGLEIENGKAIQLAETELAREVQTSRREQLASQGAELRHASWRSTAMWAAPAVFAMLVANGMFFFLYQGNKEAAMVMKEILVLVMTGALGWAAGRRSGELG